MFTTWLSRASEAASFAGNAEAYAGAIIAATGVGAPAGLALIGEGETISGVSDAVGAISGFASFKNDAYAVETESEAVLTLQNDVNQVAQWFNGVGSEVASLAQAPQTSLSTSLQVGALTIPTITTGWVNNTAHVQAMVPITNTGNESGEAEGILDIYKESMNTGSLQRELVNTSPAIQKSRSRLMARQVSLLPLPLHRPASLTSQPQLMTRLAR